MDTNISVALPEIAKRATRKTIQLCSNCNSKHGCKDACSQMAKAPERIMQPDGRIIIVHDLLNLSPINMKTNKNGMRLLKDGNAAYLRDGKILLVHPYPYNQCHADKAYYESMLRKSDELNRREA